MIFVKSKQPHRKALEDSLKCLKLSNTIFEIYLHDQAFILNKYNDFIFLLIYIQKNVQVKEQKRKQDRLKLNHLNLKNKAMESLLEND